MCGTKSCAILGHNPMRFAWGFDEEAAECHDMKMELAQQIMVLRQQGVTHFSVACDYGIGLYAAEIINALRNDDPELMLFLHHTIRGTGNEMDTGAARTLF